MRALLSHSYLGNRALLDRVSGLRLGIAQYCRSTTSASRQVQTTQNEDESAHETDVATGSADRRARLGRGSRRLLSTDHTDHAFDITHE